MTVPAFRIEGDRYFCLWTAEGIGIGFENVREHSDGLHGEVSIQTVNGVGEKQGHIHWARLNLSSSSSRQSLSKLLATRVKGEPIDWLNLLESACTMTAHAARAPVPLVDIATVTPSRGDAYCVSPLLPLHETSILYGDGGSGKSLLALSLAVAVAGNVALPWPIKAAVHGPVIYLDYETSKEEQAYRLQALANGCLLSALPSIEYRAAYRPIADEISSLKVDVQRTGAVLVIVDSIAPACGGEPESADVILRFMNALRSLGPGVSRLVLSHVSKADTEKRRAKPFGSAFVRNLARSCWEIRRADDEAADTLTVGLFHDKANRGRLQKPFGLTYTWQGDVVLVGTQTITDHPDLAPSASLSYRIRELLKPGPKTMAEIAEELDAKPDSVTKTLRRMQDVCRLDQYESGGRGKQNVWSLKTDEN
jgi:hypothetical protein